ncbi:hypothetical protein LCGC14_2344640 [marine sediment metagenome]|uniref:HNH nuclease domain-containing protein n=1 Tax=marine sediment metagenome TaxID=412755 RepID=A0A0F9CAW6_9ZZZZ
MVCTIESCDKPHHARGWCAMHYGRWLKHGSLTITSGQRQHDETCSIEHCKEAYKARGWCNMHYRRWSKHGDPNKVRSVQYRKCSIVLCYKPYEARGWCTKHYRRWRTHGNPMITLRQPQIQHPEMCTVEGCDRKYAGKGLCLSHYQGRISHPKRRARKKGAIINDFSLDQWTEILEEFNYRCSYCGKGNVSLTQDHVLPLSKEGNHTFDNIVPACKSCNSRKGASVGKYTPNFRSDIEMQYG